MLIVSFSLVALAPALEQVIARQRLENSAEMMGWCCVPPSKSDLFRTEPDGALLLFQQFLFDGHYPLLSDGAQYAALPNFPTRIGQVPACIFQPSGIPRPEGLWC